MALATSTPMRVTVTTSDDGKISLIKDQHGDIKFNCPTISSTFLTYVHSHNRRSVHIQNTINKSTEESQMNIQNAMCDFAIPTVALKSAPKYIGHCLAYALSPAKPG